ncbi:MAG TPA: PfkB family carbohydrate kinase [Anaerolineae bacterium]|nr:PfkB family carbohydrate kinase [Anaerolineae bacterium]
MTLNSMHPYRLQELVAKFASTHIVVVGDYFLDQYLVLDANLTETSLETGLDAYQVVAIRNCPGAAGTVTSNLWAMGVRVSAVGFIGNDGNGIELERALATTGVDTRNLLRRADCFTPTYTKPMLRTSDGVERELNRLDIKNHQVVPAEVEDAIIARLRGILPSAEAVIVVDQVEEENCGVITTQVRTAIGELATEFSQKIFMAESRAQIGAFHNVMLKPNAREVITAFRLDDEVQVQDTARKLFHRAGRTVFLTQGELGTLVIDADGATLVPAIPVTGEIDIVGAGDSALAGLTASLCAGANPQEAAWIGNLAASITIQQLGTTGTASVEQLLQAANEHFPKVSKGDALKR